MIPFARIFGYKLSASEMAATAMAMAAAVVGSIKDDCLLPAYCLISNLINRCS